MYLINYGESICTVNILIFLSDYGSFNTIFSVSVKNYVFDNRDSCSCPYVR